jgi:hypothetical protein
MALDPTLFFYSEGTITLTNGSDIATGDLVAWDPAVLPFDFIFPNDGQDGMSVVKEVLAINQIRLAKPWTSPTLTAVPYFMVRWTRHTDPRIYGVRLSDYLTRLKAIPENIEEVANEINADAAAVAAAMTALAQIEASVDADRQAAQTAAGTAGQAAATATEQAGIAQQWAEAASSGVLPDNGVTNAKLADMPAGTIKGTDTAGDPKDLTTEQVNALLAVAHGGIEIYLASATSLGIRPKGNGRLIINGTSRPVVATTLANTLFAVTQNIFVYAYWTGTAIAYDLSTTHHATHTNGVEIKSGDPTRTLVGAVNRHTDGTLRDEFLWRGVANWFNRKKKTVAYSYPQVGTANASTLALTAAAYGFVWAGDAMVAYNHASAICNVALKTGIVSVMINGALSGYEEGHMLFTGVNYYLSATGVSWAASNVSQLHSIQGSGRCAEHNVYTMTMFGSIHMEVLI